jgi:hypothetical protein
LVLGFWSSGVRFLLLLLLLLVGEVGCVEGELVEAVWVDEISWFYRDGVMASTYSVSNGQWGGCLEALAVVEGLVHGPVRLILS